jgi:hypothetical protein
MMRTSISLRFLLVLFACLAFATALPRELQRRQLTDATSYIEVSSKYVCPCYIIHSQNARGLQ